MTGKYLVEYRGNPGLVSFIIFLLVVLAAAYWLASSRPMDDDGYMHWRGVVRYQAYAGNTGTVDVPPGKGVYEVQLETGRIVLAYTMSPSGHELGECVSVRERRTPMDARPKYRIVGEAEGCTPGN